MKVLLVSPLPPPIGGIASWTVNLFEYFSVKFDDYEIIHQDTSLKYRKILRNDIISRIYYGILESFRIIKEFKKNIRESSPDIIHHTSSASLALIKDYFILEIARKKKIPFIIHWHFGRIPSLYVSNNWEWKLLRNIIRKSSISVVIDSKSYDTLAKAGFKNIVNIPNPIGINLEHRISNFFTGNNERQKTRLIFVGHIIKNKGVFELVEACSQIPFVNELLLIGPYNLILKQELVKRAYCRDKGEWLKFIGPLSNEKVLELMNQSPILVLPSYTEGFPVVVIEAMAMGCAVIATAVGAIPEMLAIESNKPCGICIPTKNVDKLKDAITYLINNPEKAQTMEKNGKERVLNNYTLERIVEQYKSCWFKAISN
jgi:glycosyltransferase involved in cell wall biosynthesis